MRIVHEPLMIAAEDTGLDERHRRPGRLRLRLENYSSVILKPEDDDEMKEAWQGSMFDGTGVLDLCPV